MNVMQLKKEIREWVTHLIKGLLIWWGGLPPPWREEKGARGCRTPMGCSPFSYIRWHLLLSSFRHLVHSIPYLVAPPIRKTLKEALPKLLATNTWRSGGGGGVPADPYFRCPAGPRAWRTSPNRTCDRVRRCRRLWRLGHDLEIVKWTTTSTTYVYIESSSATFVREHKIPLPIFEG
jgi:hypothetical protein